MPTYLMLTNLTAEGVRTLKNNPGRMAEVNQEVEQIGAKVVAQYATLGQYDFVTVVEAPDEKTMAKVSVELGSRGTMTSQTLTAMPADRARRRALRPAPALEGPGRRRRRPRARDRAGAGALGGRAGAALRARQRRDRRRRRVPPRGRRPTTSRRSSPWRRERAVDLAVIGPEAALVAGVVDALEEAGRAGLRPERRRRRAGGLEGLRQGADGDGRGADRLPRPAPQPRGGGRAAGRAAYPTVLKADGLAAGKGVIVCADEGRGARGARRLLHRAALRRDGRWCWRSSSRARSSRCWRSATARTWCRSLPPRTTSGSSTATEGPNTGGMGSYSPVPGFGAAEVEEIVDGVHRPVVAAMAERGPALPRRPLRRADDRARRPQGARVQRPLRRPRDAGGAAAAALRPARPLPRARASRAGWPASTAEFDDDWAVTVVLASAGYPESSSKGDVIHGLAEAAELAEVTHAGTAERDGEIVTAGGRVLNVTGLGPGPGRGPRSRVRCGAADLLRRDADARPTSPPARSSASPA